MKVVQINSVCGRGSTGKICVAVSELLTKNDVENYILYSRFRSKYEKSIKYENDFYAKCQAFREKFFGTYGFEAKLATRKLIRTLNKIKPDIVHLHILHSHDCHLEMLFEYLRENKIKVFWTFHDCWALTGYCEYFDVAECEKWKEVCSRCPQINKYSWVIDRSTNLYTRKKNLIKGIDLTVITPSKWLANIVKKSFMKDVPVKVIHNGIDLELFKRNAESSFRQDYGIGDKFIILGIAFEWDKRKGIDAFIKIAEYLPEEKFCVVLVGTNSVIDKILPSNIISIHKTNNQKELVDIYSASDLFFNPTREDNFPTVNIEALACGLPVLTFNTGGSPEMIDETCGSILEKNNVEIALSEIQRIAKERPYSIENCRIKSLQYDMWDKYNEYMNLYLM